MLRGFGMSGSFYLLSIICQKKQANNDPDSDQVSINFGTYRILYQTECTKIRNMLKCVESIRSIVNEKSEDMNKDITTSWEDRLFQVSQGKVKSRLYD